MEQFRQHQKERNIKLSPLVFIMKAVVQVLKNHPNFNASLDENSENLVIKKYFNLGIAVDTPNGLVVPVVRDVGKKSLIELAKELTETSVRAREGLLKPEEMKDAGFTIFKPRWYWRIPVHTHYKFSRGSDIRCLSNTD